MKSLIEEFTFGTFLETTIGELREHGKDVEDVRWVGGDDYWFSWEEFAALARELPIHLTWTYDFIHTPEDLVIVGEDWFLRRVEDDGRFSWRFFSLPQRPKRRSAPMGLTFKQARKELGKARFKLRDLDD